ncbi:MAG: phytoene/squalene synthase family protein [Spirochaeta sp.]|jgi:phytoene synthase|nr:phytoene/squalene synthase family protein [Spirochaeta sp.]
MYAAGSVHYETFRNGSKTYFNSSRFFPEDVRRDVFALYGFVRTADDFVDRVPQDRDGFTGFVNRYRAALHGPASNDPIIDSFVELSRRKGFDPAWTDAFLHSMASDLDTSRHETIDASLAYIYGSAEVIGLFMSRIMNLDAGAENAAQMLGRAMQFINFIRDIAEDNKFGRIYLPISESSLNSLDEAETRVHGEEFVAFIHAQLQRYMMWQEEAEAGYGLIPRRYRIPIKTAGDMYKWTGQQIAENPFIVYNRKVKPHRARIVFSGLFNLVSC